MTEYDAVVYDLDGTLVELDVDWAAVADDVREVYAAADVEPPSTNLWDMLEGADAAGLDGEVESTIAAHEREGARSAPRLVLSDDLLERSVPVGVCSLNCEAACRIALEEHDLATAGTRSRRRNRTPNRCSRRCRGSKLSPRRRCSSATRRGTN